MRLVRGITRTVILTKRYAIKMPRMKQVGTKKRGWQEYTFAFCHAVMANISELQQSHLDCVCPVIFSIGIVNVYRRCEPLIEDPPAEALAVLLDKIHSQDYKKENLGWLDGRLVFLDYDMSREVCKLC